MIFWKTSRGGPEAMFQTKSHIQTNRNGRKAIFQVQTHQTSRGDREVMFILSDHMAQDTCQTKPHKMEYCK